MSDIQGQNVTPANDCLLFAEVLDEERNILRPKSPSDTGNISDPSPHRNDPLSTLAISGGCIRSETFALGILQGLTQPSLLSTFDYLSTLSGGGNAGAWLSAWIQRRKSGTDIIAEATRQAPRDSAQVWRHLVRSCRREETQSLRQ